MTILWIPHSPLSSGAVRRDQHLIRHLKDEHHIISVTWETRSGALSLRTFWEGLHRYAFTLEDGRTAYHVRRLPDVTRPLRRNEQTSMRLNRYLFRKDIRHLIEREAVDLIITAYSRYMTGVPPFDVDVPIIFDYLDCAKWTTESPSEKPYLIHSDAVLCVSQLALEQARTFNANAKYLPNGADVARLRAASGQEVREQYGLSNCKVVSIIGLAVSRRPYFIEAVLRAKEQVPELKCLIVGESERVSHALQEIPNAEDTFVYVGPVPYEKVASYFAASDVGLYPAMGASSDDGRSPIKIFEYTALGIPVVAASIREVENLSFQNIVTTQPNAAAFADGIMEAIGQGRTEEPAVEQYDWRGLAGELEEMIEDTVTAHRKLS